MSTATAKIHDDPLEAGQGSEENQFLSFKLAGEVYAVGILNVREIIDYGGLTAVPMMPDFIRGVINLRGSVIPVVDLAVRFGDKPGEVTKRTSIVITEIEVEGESDKIDIGVIVDGVNEVLDIPPADIEPPPSFGVKLRTDFIRGMGKVNDRFLVLLNIDRVLSVDELSILSDVQRGNVEEGNIEALTVASEPQTEPTLDPAGSAGDGE